MSDNSFKKLFEFEKGREGFYGDLGGAFIPEIIHETIAELQGAAAPTPARKCRLLVFIETSDYRSSFRRVKPRSISAERVPAAESLDLGLFEV